MHYLTRRVTPFQVPSAHDPACVGLQLVDLSLPLEDNVHTWARHGGRAVAALCRQSRGTSGTEGGKNR